MRKQYLSLSLLAALALSLPALGQERKDIRVEKNVIGPVGGVVVTPDADEDDDDGDEMDVHGLNAVGSLILGVEGQAQDADEKGNFKVRVVKPQDAGKEGTIVKEIDLGDGRKLKIVISTEVSGEGKGGLWKGLTDLKAPRARMNVPDFKVELPRRSEGGDYKVYTSPSGGARTDPHGFRVEGFGGDVKEQMERAMRAFDRAREEFIRAFKEGAGPDAGQRTGPKIERRRAKKSDAEDVIIERKPSAVKVETGDEAIEKAHAELKEQIKAKIEDELKKNEAEAKAKKAPHTFTFGVEPQILGVAPGASAKKEIDELRKEIKELEKMVRDLKADLEKRKGE
jgi:hypothetical protein